MNVYVRTYVRMCVHVRTYVHLRTYGITQHTYVRTYKCAHLLTWYDMSCRRETTVSRSKSTPHSTNSQGRASLVYVEVVTS